MKLIILENYAQASEWAAKYIRNRIIQFNPGPNKYFTLGLPTGKLQIEALELWWAAMSVALLLICPDSAVALKLQSIAIK